MKDRIRQLMEAQHMNQQTFASFTGIGTASLSSIFTGRTRPTLNHVDAILEKFPNVNPLWLLKGQGGMMLSDDDKQSTEEATANHTSEGANTEGNGTTKGTVTSSDKVTAGSNSFANTGTSLQHPRNTTNYTTAKATSFQFEAEKTPTVSQRKITEIRVFYDDQTWESFVPKKEK